MGYFVYPRSQSKESFEKFALQGYFWGIVSNRQTALSSLLLGLISMPSIIIRPQIIMYVLRQIGNKILHSTKAYVVVGVIIPILGLTP